MFPIHQVDITLKTKSVNNKRIFKEIDDLVIEVIKFDTFRMLDPERFDEIIFLLEDVLFEFVRDEEKVDHIDVISDNRNNSSEDKAAKRVNILVKYRQKNCFNITELHYTVAF